MGDTHWVAEDDDGSTPSKNTEMIERLQSQMYEIQQMVNDIQQRKFNFQENMDDDPRLVRILDSLKEQEERTAVSILGPSMNAIIIDVLIKENKALDRKEIAKKIKKIKKEKSSQLIRNRIHDGRDTINFWIHQLLSKEIINRVEGKRPMRFEINQDHVFIKFLTTKKRSGFENYYRAAKNWEESKNKSESTDLLWHLLEERINCPQCGMKPGLLDSSNGTLRCPCGKTETGIKEFDSQKRELANAYLMQEPEYWAYELPEIEKWDGAVQEDLEERIKGELQKTENISNYDDFVCKILNDKKEKKDFIHHLKLIDSLKRWRKHRAGKKPAFIIFNDKTLMEIVINLPSNHKELLGISGIGETKIDQFGSELLRFLKKEGRKCWKEKKIFEIRWEEYQSQN